jgi:hypothetical protein
MTKATFEGWDRDDVERTFDIEYHHKFPLLEGWIAANHPVSERERETIADLQVDLFRTIDSWNEDELKFKFIAPFVSLVRFDTKYTSVFTQRTLSATVKDIELLGCVDFVVATGKSKPLAPFFFLHEYKRTFAPDSDPLAQLLVEMLAAQELNETEHPIYGCYVIGRLWYFVVLRGREYAQSLAFDATQSPDIISILSILKEANSRLAEWAESLHR